MPTAHASLVSCMINSKIGGYLLGVGVIACYTLLGYVFNIEVLKIFTVSEGDVGVSFIGILICVVTLLLLPLFFNKKNGATR